MFWAPSYDARGRGVSAARPVSRCSHALTVRSAPWAQRACDRFDGVARAQRSMIPQRARGLSRFSTPRRSACGRWLAQRCVPPLKHKKRVARPRKQPHNPDNREWQPLLRPSMSRRYHRNFHALATPAHAAHSSFRGPCQQAVVPCIQRCKRWQAPRTRCLYYLTDQASSGSAHARRGDT